MEKSMGNRFPMVLDTQGSDVHAGGARIRAVGPVAVVELPEGVPAVIGHRAPRGGSMPGPQDEL
jgi:hypothetical protein